jgi:hypothetical protein
MISRRKLLASLGGALLASGCKSAIAPPSSCDDTTRLTEEERGVRKALAYADRSTDPSKACKSCLQWVPPPSEGSCGGCKLLKGPVHPDGTCKAFVVKA